MTCVRLFAVFEYPHPTLNPLLIMHGRISFLNSFPDLFRSHISEALHLPFHTQVEVIKDLLFLSVIVAERVVRIRIRRRVVTVHRTR